MALSKNQKRKFKRYEKIPMTLRDLWERDKLEFSYIFNDEVQDVKKQIYRKPYYRYQDIFETSSPKFLRIDLCQLRMMLNNGRTAGECAEFLKMPITAITRAIKELKAVM